MAKITTREARLSVYQVLAPLIADLSEDLGYVVPIYWPGIDYAHPPDKTNVYIHVEESSVDKEAEGIEAISGSDATEQINATVMLTQAQDELVKCQRFADKATMRLSRGREYFDLANDKSIILMPCIQEPITIRDGRRVLPLTITFYYETF